MSLHIQTAEGRSSVVSVALQGAIDLTNIRYFNNSGVVSGMKELVSAVNSADTLPTFEDAKALACSINGGEEYTDMLYREFLSLYFFHFFCSPHREGTKVVVAPLSEPLYLNPGNGRSGYHVQLGERVELTLVRYSSQHGEACFCDEAGYCVAARDVFDRTNWPDQHFELTILA